MEDKSEFFVMPQQNKIIVESGYINSNGIGDFNLVIKVFFPISVIERNSILICFLSEKTKNVQRIPLSTLNLLDVARGGSVGRIRLQIPKSLAAFSEVKVFLNSEDMGNEAIYRKKNYHLSRLFANNEEEFSEFFFREKKRIRHDETLKFATQQILLHYAGSAKGQAVAAVIAGYRSIESGDTHLASSTLHILKKILPRIGALERSQNPREDGPHLVQSVMIIIWHLEIYLESDQSLIEILLEAIEHIFHVSEPLSLTNYNVCRTFFIASYLLNLFGCREFSLKIANYGIKFFNVTMKKEKEEPNQVWKYPTWEIRETLEVVESLKLISEENSKKFSPKEALNIASRIKSEEVRLKMSVKFENICNKISNKSGDNELIIRKKIKELHEVFKV